MMKTTGDNLGYMGKVRSKAMGESLREDGVGVIKTANFSGIVDMALHNFRPDLLVVLYQCQ